MHCKKCGKQMEGEQKVCNGCGGKAFEMEKVSGKENFFTRFFYYKGVLNLQKIISIAIFIGALVLSIYFGLDEGSVEKNNSALDSYNDGDADSAIVQLIEAREDAFTDDMKLNASLNLAYVYLSEMEMEKALVSLKDAFSYADEYSFEHYLILGEIALVELDPAEALLNYNKAHDLKPRDFQINNALSLFYVDMDEVAIDYYDYPKALAYAKTAFEVSEPMVKDVARMNLGLAYYFNDMYDEAIEMFIILDSEKDPYVAYWLGLSYAFNEDHVKGKYFLQKAVDSGIEVSEDVLDYLGSN